MKKNSNDNSEKSPKSRGKRKVPSNEPTVTYTCKKHDPEALKRFIELLAEYIDEDKDNCSSQN